MKRQPAGRRVCESGGAETPSDGTQRVAPLLYRAASDEPVPDSCEVAVEAQVTVAIESVGEFPLLCTPCDLDALAVGFAFSEGLISSIDDVRDCTHRPCDQRVLLRLVSPRDCPADEHLVATSSGAVSRQRNIQQALAGEFRCGNSFRAPLHILHAAMAQLRAGQEIFQRTGGTHAIALIDAGGQQIAIAEDVGRHNALDKAVGKCLLRSVAPAGKGAVLSGRVSVELVAKAARAGIELIIAVSAPTSLAVEAANRSNVTLCGFVRHTRATVYTHPQRIIGAPAQRQRHEHAPM